MCPYSVFLTVSFCEKIMCKKSHFNHYNITLQTKSYRTRVYMTPLCDSVFVVKLKTWTKTTQLFFFFCMLIANQVITFLTNEENNNK